MAMKSESIYINSNDKTADKQLDGELKQLVAKYGYYKINKRLGELKTEQNKRVVRYEKILDPSVHRFTTFPITYQDVWSMYKYQQANYWKAEEVDFSSDPADFAKLCENTQQFIKMVLAFFAGSDGLVNYGLDGRITQEVQVPEILYLYQWQIMMENIHSEVYSLMLNNIVDDPEEEEHLFNAFKNVKSLKMIFDWAMKWIESDTSFAHRIVANTVVEGVFFSGAFASIYWIKQYNTSSSSSGSQFLNGLITSNHFIARDEGLHCETGCLIYSKLENRLSEEEVHQIVGEGVEIAKNFMSDALPVRLIGMNSDKMSDYIEYIGDRLLRMLKYRKMYNKKNPFKFMETIGLCNKSNFFEIRPHEYQDAHIMNKSNLTTSSDDSNLNSMNSSDDGSRDDTSDNSSIDSADGSQKLSGSNLSSSPSSGSSIKQSFSISSINFDTEF